MPSLWKWGGDSWTFTSLLPKMRSRTPAVYFGDSNDITDVLQDIDNWVKFFVSSVHLFALPLHYRHRLTCSSWQQWPVIHIHVLGLGLQIISELQWTTSRLLTCSAGAWPAIIYVVAIWWRLVKFYTIEQCSSCRAARCCRQRGLILITTCSWTPDAIITQRHQAEKRYEQHTATR